MVLVSTVFKDIGCFNMIVSVIILCSIILILWITVSLGQTICNKKNSVYVYKHREYKRINGKVMVVKVEDEKNSSIEAFTAYFINNFKSLFMFVFPSIIDKLFL